ncbi:MAG: hypothetical protein HUJ96_02050 [Marinilabiliaceae bacterium]|nr:hypothetical protein [Marinilabiliaceae bacterium]
MVKIYYNNKDIERLVSGCKSDTYKNIRNKIVFMKVLLAFKAILKVIGNVIELENYHWLRYDRNDKYSSVKLETTGVSGELYFTEKDNGTLIIINDLIIK